MEPRVPEREDVVPYRTTVMECQAFLDSRLWQELRTEITIWMEVLQTALEQESIRRELFRTQGRLQALREVLALPQHFLETLIADNAREARKEQEDG